MNLLSFSIHCEFRKYYVIGQNLTRKWPSNNPTPKSALNILYPISMTLKITVKVIWGGGQGGRPLPPPAPLPPPSRPLVSLLPPGAARALRAQKFPLFPSLPFYSLLPPPAPSSPSSLPPPPLLPPPSPSSPPSRPLISPLPLTLSATLIWRHWVNEWIKTIMMYQIPNLNSLMHSIRIIWMFKVV